MLGAIMWRIQKEKEKAETNIKQEIQYIEVSYGKGGFSGQLADYGIWSWDNEILVGFDLK